MVCVCAPADEQKSAFEETLSLRRYAEHRPTGCWQEPQKRPTSFAIVFRSSQERSVCEKKRRRNSRKTSQEVSPRGSATPSFELTQLARSFCQDLRFPRAHRDRSEALSTGGRA